MGAQRMKIHLMKTMFPMMIGKKWVRLIITELPNVLKNIWNFKHHLLINQFLMLQAMGVMSPWRDIYISICPSGRLSQILCTKLSQNYWAKFNETWYSGNTPWECLRKCLDFELWPSCQCHQRSKGHKPKPFLCTVKPVFPATWTQRPPVLNGRPCLPPWFFPLFLTWIQRPPAFNGHGHLFNFPWIILTCI